MLQIGEDLFLRRLYLHRQDLLLLTPVDRQDPMPCQAAHRLLKVIVHLIDRLLVRILCLGDKAPLLHRYIPDEAAVVCFIGNEFRDNIPGSCNGLFHSGHSFFFTDILLRRLFHRLCHLLPGNGRCQRLQPLFLGNGGPGPPLGPVRPIQVLYHHQRLRCQDLLL